MKKFLTTLILIAFLSITGLAAQAAGTTDLQRMEIMQTNPGDHEPSREQKITVYLYRNSTEITANIQLNVTLPNGTERKIGTNRHKLSSVAYSNASSWRNTVFTVDNNTLSKTGVYTFKAENLNDPETQTATFNYRVKRNNSTMELALLLGLLGTAGFFAYLGVNTGKPEDRDGGEQSQWRKWFRQIYLMFGIFFALGGVFIANEIALQSRRFDYLSTTYTGYMTGLVGLIIFLVVMLVVSFLNSGMKTGADIDDEVETAL